MFYIFNEILQTQQLILFIRSHKLQTIYKTNVANTVSDNICDDEEESAKAHKDEMTQSRKCMSVNYDTFCQSTLECAATI